MLNLIKHGPYIDNIYLYAKAPFELKYRLLINKEKIQALNTEMIWIKFAKILKNAVQTKNKKNDCI